MEIVIWGASDDLIEVEGAAKGCDEYGGGGEKPRRVVCLPTGDVFRFQYGSDAEPSRAVWYIEHELASGQLDVTIERAPPGDEPDPYSDRATVRGQIESVEVWDEWPPSKREIRERVEEVIEDGTRGWDDAKVARVWEALRS